MSLINVKLTDNNISPTISKVNDINNKTIYCDLSGLALSNFSLNLNPSNNYNSPNSVVKCNVLFRNNGLNPTINTLTMNNVPTTNFFINNRDASTTSQMTNQEFIITYDADTGKYTSISTIRKYD
jgi:hypothetical protein